MAKKFFSAKVNVNQNIWSGYLESLVQRIPAAIEAKAIRKSGNWKWQFVDVEWTQDRRFIYGNLSRAKNKRTKVVVDDKTTFHEVPNATENAFFAYNPVKEILIFEENSSIPRDTFMEMFGLLIYSGDTTIGNLKIILFQGDDDLYKKLVGYEVLTKIQFDIIPPNFIGEDELGDMSELIEEAHGTHLKYSVENEDGIKKEGPFIKSAIDMVKRGYGYARSFGYNKLIVKTRKGKETVKKDRKKFASKDAVFHTFVVSTNPSGMLEEIQPLHERTLKSLERQEKSNDKNREPDQSTETKLD